MDKVFMGLSALGVLLSSIARTSGGLTAPI